ncbi:MAG: hypothetical protein ACPL25_10300 [Ignavibacteria bacterium]
MINLPLIKRNFKNILTHPVIMMLILLMVIMLLLIVFNLEIKYKGGKITYLKFFYEFQESEISVWGVRLIENVFGLLSSAIMFFLILQSSSLLPELIKSSMLTLLLTKIRNRFKLFLSYLMSELIVVFVLIGCFGLLITLIVYVKSNGFLTFLPIASSLALLLKFASIFGFISILGLISRNSTFIALVALLTYFVLIPLVANADKHFGNSLLVYLKYVFPPALSDAELYLKLLNGEVQSVLFTLAYILLYFTISVRLFESMEIT